MAIRNRPIEGGAARPVALVSAQDGVAFPTTALAGSADRDAFGIPRVSAERQTLFDSKQIIDYAAGANTENHGLFYSQATTGTGTTTTYSKNCASTTLAIADTTAGSRIRYTRQRFNYQPGKSFVFTMTFSKFLTTAGQTKRVGYFDGSNGIFLESKDGVVYLVVRSNITGTPAETRIAQTSWSEDTLDGNGNSGLNINWANSVILFVDFEWLGVGDIRAGVVVDNTLTYFHKVKNSNQSNGVYMSTPNLPLRWEIVNDGTGAAGEFEIICATLVVEGGQQVTGVVRGPNPATIAGGDTATCASSGTTYAIAAMRLNSLALDAQVELYGVSFSLGSSDDAILSLHLNPTFASAPSFSRIPQSAVDYAIITATAIALTDPGYVIWTGTVSPDSEDKDWRVNTIIRPGADIAGTADVIALCVSPITPNVEPRGIITWREQL